MSVQPLDVVAAARGWLGTPFRHQASLKGVGADCYGLVRGVARELGLIPGHVPLTDYAAMPDRTMQEHLDRELVRVRVVDRRPGDVVAFAWGRETQHLGILSERNTVIHGYGRGTQGGVVETSLAGRHRQRLRGVYRFPEFV